MQNETKLRYRAFISYSHVDAQWGKWLHSAIEAYRPPARARAGTARIRPVFRDDEESAASPDLAAAISKALEQSDALVVICSPHSARSKWVNKEIGEFKALGRESRIFGIIVDGKPYDPTNNCFPPNFLSVEVTHEPGTKALEPLAIDVRVYGRHDTMLKVVSGLLNISYDVLKRRDRQRAIRRVIIASSAMIVLFSVYAASLFFQARAVNLQVSSVLAALALKSSEEGDHGRALRFATLSATGSLISPVAADAEPALVRTYYFSTLHGEFREHKFSIYSIAFDASAERLLSGSQDGTVRFLKRTDAGSWVPEQSFIKDEGHVMDARFAERGKAVIVLSMTGSGVTLWREGSGTWTRQGALSPHQDLIRAFDVSKDGNLAVLGYQDNTVEIWQFSKEIWSLAKPLPDTSLIPTAVAIAEGNARVAIGFFDGSIRIYDLNNAGAFVESSHFQLLQTEARHLAFSSSGDRLLAGALRELRVVAREQATVWIEIGQIGPDMSISQGAFLSESGNLVVTNAGGSAAKIWIEQSGRTWLEVGKFGTGTQYSRSIAASTDGTIFATGGNDDVAVRIWAPGGLGSWKSYMKVRSGIGLVQDTDKFVEDHTSFSMSSINSKDGRRTVESDVYGIARIKDNATGIQVAALDVSDATPYTIEFSDDEKMLLALHGNGDEPNKEFSVEALVSLTGVALTRTVCSERMSGKVAILSEDDVKAAPFLAGRGGEDVCSPPNSWKRVLATLRFLFGRSN
jgi:WD40 repeat protein